MIIDLEAYQTNYHVKDKYIDNWQETIKVLPFNAHPTQSGFDKRCSLQGTTGEFFRRMEEEAIEPIEDFEVSVVQPVVRYLETQRPMTDEKIKEFTHLLRDTLCVNGNLNITDAFFLKYLPTVPHDENMSPKERKKYRDGQRKLAAYLFSCVDGHEFKINENSKQNLFFSILKQSISGAFTQRREKEDAGYYILPFIQRSFREDLKWLLSKDETVVIKYIHIFLHFYACYALTQAMAVLSANCSEGNEKPVPFFFILYTERVSVNHDAVIRGWNNKLPKHILDSIYGRHQALDIANSVLGGQVGFYPEVLAKLEETPFVENREKLETLLKLYKEDKTKQLSQRSSEKNVQEEFDTTVLSYQDFLSKLERLCISLQSVSYVSRIRKKLVDILSCRFLRKGRGHYVLALDKEMLIFLVALMTRDVPKNKNMKLEDVYKRFNSYGIHFNRGSRQEIEEYLLKLNILIRKSDSGEAQYVKSLL